MDRKILLSLLVFAGGMLDSMASLLKEHKDFVNSIKRSQEEIEGNTLPDPEKKKGLMALSDRVVDKMNENPNKSKWTNAKKVEYVL
jgi:hypothetical protein